MSSVGIGTCAPTHVNMEMSVANYEGNFAAYENETGSIGSVGYSSLSGVYISKDFIRDGVNISKHSPTFSADFWRDYPTSDALINSLSVSVLTSNSSFYPPQDCDCVDGTLGCLNSCSKTDSCTSREAQGGECMVVVMRYASDDPGHLQAVFANLKIPAYFCFLGDPVFEDFVVAMHERNIPVAFYHFEPDPFHLQYPDTFERIFLPRATPEKVALNTGKFGEHGYGGKTDNPVAVDFQAASLDKYIASFITGYNPLSALISKFSLSNMNMNTLQEIYVNVSDSADDPVFIAACTWIKSNYNAWNGWLDPLPLCDVRQHMSFTLIGCEANETNATAFPRHVDFYWTFPDPTNPEMPYNCDGDINSTPATFFTSRSCVWLRDNYEIWIDWIQRKPQCDASFYFYNATDCDQPGAQRLARFFWHLPDPLNASLSLECNGGVSLPANVLFECEYVPYHSTTFKATAGLAGFLAVLFVVAMIAVCCFRSAPIIKRSQYQFLVSMLLGGVLMCGTTILYAGKPTTELCRARPSFVSYSFTLIFGSLLVKSMRVYRVFLSSSMKRVKVSSFTMFKFLVLFIVVDFMIIATWMSIDPLVARTQLETVPDLDTNQVEVARCTSSSFIFTALMIFWKAIVLFVGMYLSFAIRNVSSDFQESIWIFACSLVVLVTSILVLPTAYLVTTTAIFFHLFFVVSLLLATLIVMMLMLVPKFRRLKAVANIMRSTTSINKKKASSTSSAADPDTASASGTSVRDVINIFPAFIRLNSNWRTIRSITKTPVQPFEAPRDETRSPTPAKNAAEDQKQLDTSEAWE